MSQKNDQDSDVFEHLYIKERKKSRIFMTVATVTTLAAVGLSIHAMQKRAEPLAGGHTLGSNGPMQLHGQGGGSGNGMRFRGPDVESFLNDDGSVDTNKVNEMLEQVPADFKSNFLDRVESQIDEAKNDGGITAPQADALKKAFGITGGSSEG
jgi:hypothetical protein